MDIFRIFDSLNYLPNLRVAMEAVQDTHAVCEAAICYTGDILDERRDKYSLKYYVRLAKELEKMGAHFLAIKDMAGLCRPYAAHKLVKALKEEIGLPIHFHTHDTSGVAVGLRAQGRRRGRGRRRSRDRLDVRQHAQPNLNSIVAALQHTPRDTGLDLDALERILRLLGARARVLPAVRHRAADGRAEVYLHEMPGGQYTNLKEQAAGMGVAHRWPEIARTYAEVNQLFGDIVKVTPSPRSSATWRCSSSPRHQARGCGEPRARQHALPRERHRHAERRPRLARGRLARGREPCGAGPRAPSRGAGAVPGCRGFRAQAVAGGPNDTSVPSAPGPPQEPTMA